MAIATREHSDVGSLSLDPPKPAHPARTLPGMLTVSGPYLSANLLGKEGRTSGRLAIALVAAIGAAGCGGSSPSTPPTAPSTPTAPGPSPAPPSIVASGQNWSFRLDGFIGAPSQTISPGGLIIIPTYGSNAPLVALEGAFNASRDQ